MNLRFLPGPVLLLASSTLGVASTSAPPDAGPSASRSVGLSASRPDGPNTPARAPTTVDLSTLGASSSPDPKAEQTYRSAMEGLKHGYGYDSIASRLKELVARNPYVAPYKEAYGAALIAQALDGAAASGPDPSPGSRAPVKTMPPIQLFRMGVQQIEEAIQLQPNVPDFDQTLGWAYLANTRLGIDGEIDKSRKRALDLFQKAVELDPSEPVYWQAVGDFYRLNPRLYATRAGASARPDAKGRGATTTAAPRGAPPSPAVDAYLRVEAARPRDASVHFSLFQAYDEREDNDRALNELALVYKYDRTNAVPLYLLAALYLQRAQGGPVPGDGPGVGPGGDGAADSGGTDWRAAARTVLEEAAAAPTFDLFPYHPAYPDILAPAIRRALGDSLTPSTLELYDRLKRLSGEIVAEGDGRQSAGDPADAEKLYSTALTLGQRLVDSAMDARDRYLLHLPELSAGLAVQEQALGALRALYDKYAMSDRLPWIQQQQLALDQVRQIVSQASEAATPAAAPSASASSPPAPSPARPGLSIR